MKIVFMGTPMYAVTVLRALKAAGHDICAVFTQKDTLKNRGMKTEAPEVKTAAQELGIPVYQPEKVKDELEALSAMAPDAIVVAAYGKLLPRSVLSLPKYGCINVHASLLPKYRGASPITAAIADGEKVTGISIMQMAEGLDTGDVFEMAETPITDVDTYGSLHDRLSLMGGELLLKVLDGIEKGTAKAVPQPEAGASYAKKVETDDLKISFSDMGAAKAACIMRAYDPKPGAFAVCGGERYKLFGPAADESLSGEPGIIEPFGKQKAVVYCKNGGVIVSEIQAPGGKRIPSGAFLRGLRKELRFE